MTTNNLVANGNFATGDFTDWTLGGNYTSGQIFIDTNAEGGSSYAAGMGSMGSDGTLSQTIATTAGQTYTLSFWLQNEASDGNDFTAMWDGQPLLALTNASAFGYTEYTFTVTAIGSTSTLEFSAANGASQWNLDNVSLTSGSSTAAPAAPAINSGGENSNQSVTLTGTAPDGATVTVWDGATALGTTIASSTGAWSFATASLSFGSYAFTATDATSAGTSAASSPLDVTVTTPPAPLVINTGVENSNQSVTLTGTAPDGATVTVSTLTTSNGLTTELGTTTASSTGAWSFTTTALSAGVYDFTATDTTSAGTSAASSPLVVGVSSTNPDPVTYYVSSEIGSDNNAGTSATAPLASLQAAANLVKPGDTVEVMNGTYTGNAPGGGDVLDITTSGTASAPITFEAAPGQTPVINSSGGWNAINIEASYIVVNGFTVVGDAANYTLSQALAGYSSGNANLDGNGIAVEPNNGVVSNHITIENNTVYNEPGAGILTQTADYVQILNNVVYDNAHWSAWGESGISVAGSANSDTNPGVHDIISGNTVYGNAQLVPTTGGNTITDGEGIILDTNTGPGATDPGYVGEFLVENNTVYNNGSSGIESFLTNNAVITGNTSYGNDTENLQAASNAEIFINQSSNNTVTDNSTTAPAGSTTTPPAAPVISTGVANSNETVTLTGTAPDGSTVTVSDGGGKLGTATANSSTGAWSFTTAALSAGSYAFTATDTTSAGTSAASSPLDVTVTSSSPTSPAAPVISTGVANSNGTVTLTGTAPDGSTVTVSDGGGKLGTATANSSTGAWSITTAALSAGSYAFTATDATSAGTSAASSPLDVTVTSSSPTPPAAPVISTGVANSNETVTLTGTAADGSTVTVSDGGGKLGTATANSSTGAWSFTTADLAAGSHAFTATDTTSAGTSAASSPFNVTVTGSSSQPSGPNLFANGNFATDNFTDWTLGGNYTSTNVGPEIFIDTNAEGGSTYAAGMGSIGSDGTLSQAIATTPGQTYTLTFWLQNEESGTNDFQAIWNGQTLLSLANAAQSGYSEHTYTVRAASSTTTLEFSAANSPSQWDLDNISLTANGTSSPTPPAAPVIETAKVNSNTDPTVTLTGTAPDGSRVTISDGGATPLGTTTASSTGSWTFTTPDLPAGTYAFTATDATSAGTSAASTAFDVTVTSSSQSSDPTISSIVESPASGDLDARKKVTLTLKMSENVTVKTGGGKPTLTLNDGGIATYKSGSGTNALIFTYTVAAGQNTPDLSVTKVNLNGATITNGGNTADLSLTGLTQTGPQIDTTATTASSLLESPASGDLGAGKTVALTLNMSKNVTVDTAGGSPTLTLNDGGTATYKSGSGTSALTFTYKVAAGQNTADLSVTKVNLNGATISNSGNAANLSLTGLTQTGPQIDTTTLTSPPTISSSSSPHGGEAGGGYTKAHVLTLKGAAVANSTVRILDGSAQLGTTTADSSGAWTYTTPTLNDGTHNFTVKDVSSAGKVSASSTTFAVTVVSSASLTQVGNTYNITAGASDPVLKYKGANVTRGEFGDWTPIGAVKTASGYDVAWKNTSTNQYTVWTTDNNGNYTGNLFGEVSANSTKWTSIAPIFPQSADGGGGTVPSTKVIQKDGSTTLTEVANHYYLDGSSESGPALKYKGANVTAGEFGKWTPIGAVKTAVGYDVAWKNTGSGQYTVWSIGNNGNYKGNLTGGAVSGTSVALESLEPIFHQDLNHDGVIGPVRKVIRKDGSTTLTEVANHYYLDGSRGTGPALKYKDADVTAGEFGKWTPIGAVITAGGYDVAWKNSASGQYTVWSIGNNGNYKGDLTGGAVSGTSVALESLEPIFHQDLNHDGVMGLYVRPDTTVEIGRTLVGSSGSATIGKGATLELAAADSAAVTFAGSTGTLRLDHPSTFHGEIFKFGGNGNVSGSDHIDLRDIKYSSVRDSYANGVLTVTDGKGDAAKLSLNGSYRLANFRFANDGSGGTIVYDPPVTSSSGQNTGTSQTGVPPATTGDGETLDLAAANAAPVKFAPSTGTSEVLSGFGAKDGMDPPGTTLNAQSTLGYLPNGNQADGILSFANGPNANIALLGNYMASMFAMASHNHGTITPLAEVAQSNDQSVLSSPHHA